MLISENSENKNSEKNVLLFICKQLKLLMSYKEIY